MVPQVRAAFERFPGPPIRYAHYADFLRWLVPYLEGGFYMDLDHILLKPVATIRNLFAVPVEHVGFPDYGYELVDGKVIWAVNKVYFTQYFQQKYHYYGWNPMDYKVTLKIYLRVRVQISM